MNDIIEKLPSEAQRFVDRFKSLPDNPRRERAFEAFARTGVPHRRIEGWRWSDVRTALKSVDAQSVLVAGSPLEGIDADIIKIGAKGAEFGKIAGVRISEKADTQAFASAEDMPLAALASALSDQPSSLVIEVGAELSRPLHFIFDESASELYAHIHVVVREDASATILETHRSTGGFSSVALEFDIQANARLERVIFAAGTVSAVQIVSAKVSVAKDAHFNQCAFSLGARLSRIDTRVVHREEGASAKINAAYLLGDSMHSDMTSYVRHSAAKCETSQQTKGAVKKGGKGVFQGKFYVARDAQKTDAAMEHNALLLEDGAEVNAKPELEIYADDVQCAHGNTAGALDQDALFYMRQRGIALVEAKAMLTQSFIAEAFDIITHVEAREKLTEEAHAWLMQTL